MTDPANCGRCGIACLPNAACVSGRCGKAPTALIPAQAGCTVLEKTPYGVATLSIRLVLDGGKIYWTDPGHGTVNSIATEGGAVTTLATNEMTPSSLIVRGGSVYWADRGNNTIRGLAASSATPTTLVAMVPASSATFFCDNACTQASGDMSIHGIALSPDGNTLYFAAGTDVYMVPKDGGDVVDVGSSEGPRHGVPNALAVNNEFAYYLTDGNGHVELLSLTTMCDPAAADPAHFADSGTSPTCPPWLARSQIPLLDTIYVRGDKVYWATESVRIVSVSARLDGGYGPIGYSASVNSGPITGFAVGTANAYFGEDGFIEKAANPPYGEGLIPNATVLARNQPMPSSFAIDGTNVYWTTSNCDIEMLADSPQ